MSRIALVVAAGASLLLGPLWAWQNGVLPGDLPAFYNCGLAVLSGESPYIDAHPNANPPVTLPFCAVLAWLGPAGATLGLALASVAAYAYAVARLGRGALLPALALGGFWFTLAFGQLYVLLLPLLLAGPWGLGALVAIKPQLAPILIVLFAAGHRRAALIGATVAIGLTALPALVWGPGVYLDWYEAVSRINTANDNPHHHAGLLGLWLVFDLPGKALVAPVLCGLAVWWAHRARPDLEQARDVGVLVALLAAPVVWAYYATLLLPLAARRPEIALALSLPVFAVLVALDAPGFVHGLMWTAFVLFEVRPSFFLTGETDEPRSVVDLLR